MHRISKSPNQYRRIAHRIRCVDVFPSLHGFHHRFFFSSSLSLSPSLSLFLSFSLSLSLSFSPFLSLSLSAPFSCLLFRHEIELSQLDETLYENYSWNLPLLSFTKSLNFYTFANLLLLLFFFFFFFFFFFLISFFSLFAYYALILILIYFHGDKWHEQKYIYTTHQTLFFNFSFFFF